MNNFKCEKIYNAILDKKDRIIIIGDLHADYNKTIDLFKSLELIKEINNKFIWNAKPSNTVVVQLGDQLDGGGRGVGLMVARQSPSFRRDAVERSSTGAQSPVNGADRISIYGGPRCGDAG